MEWGYKGNASFDLNIQGTKLSHRMTIADIEVPMILGYDFLYEHDCSISVKDSCLRRGNKNIKCHLQSQSVNTVFKICLDENGYLSQTSELVIESNTWPSKAKKDAYFSFCWHF